MADKKRRSPGEGGVYSYRTGAGERWDRKATVTLADGTSGPKVKRGFMTKKAAQKALREALAASGRGEYTDPSKQLLGDYLATWLDGLRLAPSTVASYRKNVRLHIAPYVGTVPLASLTSARLTQLYCELETSGRYNGVGAPGDAPAHLLDFFFNRTRDGAVSDIRIDLHQEVPADRHRLQFQMIDVGGNDRAAARHFVANKFGSDDLGNARAKRFALVLEAQVRAFRSSAASRCRSRPRFSRMATNSISGVMMPFRA